MIMSLEKQVCNFQHSMELFRSGIRHPTAFFWTSTRRLISHAQVPFLPPMIKSYPAYMIAELGSIIPSIIEDDFHFTITKNQSEWFARYVSKKDNEVLYPSFSMRLSDAVAGVALCLAKEKQLLPAQVEAA